MSLLLSIDQGTTSSRAVLYDSELSVVAHEQLELQPSYPHAGWVEHNPEALWSSVREVVARVLHGRFSVTDLAAVGMTNQRETALIWDRATGQAIGPAIVWQDRRTAPFCEQHAGAQTWLAERTGLVLDPYFSATKFAWLLDHTPGARRRAERGELAAGTVDSWLIWHLTRGAAHRIDRTNASRTLLMNLQTGQWDDELCAFFAVPRGILPEICASRSNFGEVACDGLARPGGPAILAVMGDQQASLFGQGAHTAGQAKCTYGTGAFLLAHTGDRPIRSTAGLVSTAAASLDNRAAFALEGSVFVAGAAVQWFRDGLKAIGAAPEIDILYEHGRDTSNVLFVPALTGLGAPHWAPEARGTIFGLTRDTSVADLARATIEGVAFQVAELVDAMRTDLDTPPAALRVDGGMARSDPFLQFQADLLGIPLVRAAQAESTALGAAMLAGVGAGFWTSDDQLQNLLAGGSATFEPRQSEGWRANQMARWRHAVNTIMNHYR